jgi:hypothetical protein
MSGWPLADAGKTSIQEECEMEIRKALLAIGITTKRNPDFSRPHIYVTVHKNRIGSKTKDWWYIGKNTTGRAGYLGSGKRIKNIIRKDGKGCLEVRLIEYITKVSVSNYCPEEQYWLNKMRAVPGSLNLSTSSGGLNHKDALRISQRLAKDPEWRRKNKEKTRRLAQDPEWRRKNKEKNQRLAKDPEWLRKHREHLSRMRTNPKWKLAVAEANAKRAQDPKWLRETCNAAKRRKQDPEWQRRNKEKNKRLAKDPEWQRMMLDRNRNPEIRHKQIEGIKLMNAFKQLLGIPHKQKLSDFI